MPNLTLAIQFPPHSASVTTDDRRRRLAAQVERILAEPSCRAVLLNTPRGRTQPAVADQHVPAGEEQIIRDLIGDGLLAARPDLPVVLYMGNLLRAPGGAGHVILSRGSIAHTRLVDQQVHQYRRTARISAIALDFSAGLSTGPGSVEQYGLDPRELGVNRRARWHEWRDWLRNRHALDCWAEGAFVDEGGQLSAGLHVSPELGGARSICLADFVRRHEAKLRRATRDLSAAWGGSRTLTIWVRSSEQVTDQELASYVARGYDLCALATEPDEIARCRAALAAATS